MTPDSSLFIKRNRHLSFALIISGVINIAVLSALLFWMLRERPPTPYCELKPAALDEQQIPLADQRGCREALAQLSKLSFTALAAKLTNGQMIENGYAERDLALACLIAFYHFDIQRALPKDTQPQQKRILTWKPNEAKDGINLTVYPDLSDRQFDALARFAQLERWPLTPEGLFLSLKDRKKNNDIDDHLVETFVLTPEFWTVELLFNRRGARVGKREILDLLLESDWAQLKGFVDQQRQLHDSSDARRQKFLLDYLKAGSRASALLLLKTEWEFSVKKLDEPQVLSILQLIPADSIDGLAFAKEMLASPRSSNVWRQAAVWLYAKEGEPMPKEWTQYSLLTRFVPEKAPLALTSAATAAHEPAPLKIPLIQPKPQVGRPNSSGQARQQAAQSAAAKKSVSVITQNSRKPQVPHAPPALPKETYLKSEPIKDEKNLPSKPAQIPLQSYVVQEGDSLWKIGRRFNVKAEEIKKANGLKSDTLKTGTVLKIPAKK